MRIVAFVIGLGVVLGVAASAVVGSALFGSHASHHVTPPRPSLTSAALLSRGYPPWVRRIVLHAPVGFYYSWRGKYRLPKVVAASYRHGQKTDQLVVIFDRDVVCGFCGGPYGAPPLRGKRLTGAYLARTHEMMGFGFGPG